MNFPDLVITPNPSVLGDYIVTGHFYDDAGNLLGDYGPDGTSVFTWWATQDADFQLKYAYLFSSIMAQEIVDGTSE
jgi:hypothetical protein